ncbi:MAG: TonB-dependent receptor [Bryobacteraceae bacterium]|nr:TonB-dependent receptor [Bryobacteraceae bacterium]
MAQRQFGEIQVHVVDSAGQPLEAVLSLSSLGNSFSKTFLGSDWTLTAVPLGIYQLQVQRTGFQVDTKLVEIKGEVPLSLTIALGIAPLETTVQISLAGTLLNPDETGAVRKLGGDQLKLRRPSAPGREILSLVDAQPGWLLEANGVLHPRGSEYGVQYVIDGMPLLDNRSPVYAPMLDIDDVEAITIRTGGFPAEYGHQLGGVVEVTTAQDRRPGLHGRIAAEGGSFETARSAFGLQYGFPSRDTIRLTGTGARTERYLDPTVEQNFSNRGTVSAFGGAWDRDWNTSNRTRFQVRHNEARFQVPNEQLQQSAGQRQDRDASETAGQIAYTRILSPRWLLDLRASARDVSAGLWSNSLSTPIAAFQNRGFREAYLTANVSAVQGIHNWKFGGEAIFRSLSEEFEYNITAYSLNGVPVFDDDLPSRFRFSERRQNRESALWIQDHIRVGNLTIDAGLRWDQYRLVASEQAFSPRFGVAWQVPRAGLVFRASYDRVFQTPAIENLLLASVGAPGPELLRLPVQPSRGNFFEAGFSKALLGRVRLDGSWFRRELRDFADDGLLLNTGVSFPISFAQASIQGFEAKLEFSRFGPVSGFVGYTNMIGRGRRPVSGGLFLGDEAEEALEGNDWFAITQDQRNTARAQVRWQLTSRIFVSAATQYGSGLPVELDEGISLGPLETQYGPEVLQRINLSRGRVRPNAATDLSAGWDVLRRENRIVRLQGSVMNIADRLNVVNFSGLFSGTAIAPGRWASARLSFEF